MLTRIYAILGGTILVAYLLFTLAGRELGPTRHERPTGSVRSSTGGTGGSHFWFRGFSGGK
jgi:hypothetical protein